MPPMLMEIPEMTMPEWLDKEARRACGTDEIDHSQLTDAEYGMAAERYEQELGRLRDQINRANMIPLPMVTIPVVRHGSNVLGTKACEMREITWTQHQWNYAQNWQPTERIRRLDTFQFEFTELKQPHPAVEPSARETMVMHNRWRSRQLKEKLAKVRALKLLLEHLTEDQREEYERTKAFHVETADGRRRYLLKLGTVGNIKLIKSDGPVVYSKRGEAICEGDVFCWHAYHPDGHIPDEDNVLAQKLMLECMEGEQEFLATANVS